MTRLSSKLTPKICKHCGKGYTPARPMQKACSLPCAQALGKAKTAADQKKADTKALREGREGPHEMTHYSIPDLKAIAAKFRKLIKELTHG